MTPERVSRIIKRVSRRSRAISDAMLTGRSPRIETGAAAAAWVVGGLEIAKGAHSNGVLGHALSAGILFINTPRNKSRGKI